MSSLSHLEELSWRDQDFNLEIDFSAVFSDVAWLDEGQELFKKGLSELTRIETGEAVNSDEGRMVGHYWLRDSATAPNPEIAKLIEDEKEKIKQFAVDVKKGKILTKKGENFKHILLVGIGGSALGPQLLADSLKTFNQPLDLYTIDNTDPDGIVLTLSQIPDLSKTLVLIISKSGGTRETRNGMLLVKQVFEDSGLSFNNHFIAVTGEGSLLHKQATLENWLKIFPMWDWVGGRTSIWSAVGLLPLSLMGLDIDQLLRGAQFADKKGRNKELRSNPAAMLGLAWIRLAAEKKDMVVLPYKDRLLLLSRYLQQLVMESLGKELDRNGKKVEEGLSVYGNKGSTDQHAYVQQLRDGRNNFFALFIEVLKDVFESEKNIEPKFENVYKKVIDDTATAGDYLHGFYLGTRKALKEKGRSSITITIPEVSPYYLGFLIALFERTVSFYAAYTNINAYHQPGVEAGKKAAEEAISLQIKIFEFLSKNKSGGTVSKIAESVGSDDLYTTYKILLRQAALGKVKASSDSSLDVKTFKMP